MGGAHRVSSKEWKLKAKAGSLKAGTVVTIVNGPAGGVVVVQDRNGKRAQTDMHNLRA